MSRLELSLDDNNRYLVILWPCNNTLLVHRFAVTAQFAVGVHHAIGIKRSRMSKPDTVIVCWDGFTLSGWWKSGIRTTCREGGKHIYREERRRRQRINKVALTEEFAYSHGTATLWQSISDNACYICAIILSLSAARYYAPAPNRRRH